jgi:glycosyltransferase involved in cell wall biosynthesis
MVIIEGIACGKAVIASQAGGASELFVDGENALGHAPGDAAMLARQIKRLAEDPDLRLQLGQAGRVTAERLYHRKRLATELLALYQNIHRDPAEAELEAVVQAGARRRSTP